jgi:DNA invertase Pin-like site-specific DNA recombinase
VTKQQKSEPSSITTALVYTRVSSEEQAREGVSLDAQLTECRRYAAQHGWMLGQEFQDVLSGKRDDRPAYQALLVEVRRLRAEGQLVVVVVFRLDRLGRRILERVRCREELKALGVPVHSVREGGEVSDLVANILASVAEEESRALGERVAAAKQHLTSNGWYITGQLPWGYRMRPATTEERAQGSPMTVLEPNPVEVPWVQEAFCRAGEGQTLRAVHRWVATLPNEARGGRVFAFQTFRNVLVSPVYVGRLIHGSDDVLARPSARWEPLVDDATWQRIRDYVEGHRRLPRQASQQYLLTGLLRCPVCGCRMGGRARKDRSRSYRCCGVNLGANAPVWGCATTALADQVEQAVLAEVLPLIDGAVSSLPELRQALERAWAALRTPATLQDELQERHRKQLVRETEQARARLTKAAVLFADGDIDKPGYELLRDKARVDLDAATEALSKLQMVEPSVVLPPLETVLAAAEGWGAAMHDGDIAAQREVLAALVEKVVPVRVSRGKYDVNVIWTPLGEALRVSIDPPMTTAVGRVA